MNGRKIEASKIALKTEKTVHKDEVRVFETHC